MNNKDFIKHIEETYTECVGIVKVKNKDYASSSNPFKNFQSAEIVGVGVDRAIMVRILDKLARISNLLDKPAAVKEEAIEDTLNDAINYLAILKAYISLKVDNGIKSKLCDNDSGSSCCCSHKLS